MENFFLGLGRGIGVGVIPSTPGHKLVSLTSCDRVVSGLLRRYDPFLCHRRPSNPNVSGCCRVQGAAVFRVLLCSGCCCVQGAAVSRVLLCRGITKFSCLLLDAQFVINVCCCVI